MYANHFQGGTHVDVFVAKGSNPLSAWKLTGAVKKEYDKSGKGMVAICEGSTSKMQLPANDKTNLGLRQPYLVIQGQFGKSFSVEMRVSDMAGKRRRIHLSSGIMHVDRTQMHARLPLNFVKRGGWLNLVLHVADLFDHNFPGSSFAEVDGITLHSSLRLRRLFTLAAPPLDTSGDAEVLGLDPFMEVSEPMPRALELPHGVEGLSQTINMTKIEAFSRTDPSSSSASRKANQPIKLEQRKLLSSNDGPGSASRIAFGSRVAISGLNQAPASAGVNAVTSGSLLGTPVTGRRNQTAGARYPGLGGLGTPASDAKMRLKMGTPGSTLSNLPGEASGPRSRASNTPLGQRARQQRRGHDPHVQPSGTHAQQNWHQSPVSSPVQSPVRKAGFDAPSTDMIPEDILESSSESPVRAAPQQRHRKIPSSLQVESPPTVQNGSGSRLNSHISPRRSSTKKRAHTSADKHASVLGDDRSFSNHPSQDHLKISNSPVKAKSSAARASMRYMDESLSGWTTTSSPRASGVGGSSFSPARKGGRLTELQAAPPSPVSSPHLDNTDSPLDMSAEQLSNRGSRLASLTKGSTAELNGRSLEGNSSQRDAARHGVRRHGANLQRSKDANSTAAGVSGMVTQGRKVTGDSLVSTTTYPASGEGVVTVSSPNGRVGASSAAGMSEDLSVSEVQTEDSWVDEDDSFHPDDFRVGPITPVRQFESTGASYQKTPPSKESYKPAKYSNARPPSGKKMHNSVSPSARQMSSHSSPVKVMQSSVSLRSNQGKNELVNSPPGLGMQFDASKQSTSESIGPGLAASMDEDNVLIGGSASSPSPTAASNSSKPFQGGAGMLDFASSPHAVRGPDGASGHTGSIQQSTDEGEARGENTSPSKTFFPSSLFSPAKQLERLHTPPIVPPSRRAPAESPLTPSIGARTPLRRMGTSSKTPMAMNAAIQSAQSFAQDCNKSDQPSSSVSEDPVQADEDDDLELMYDPILNCYYEPKTNKYFELRRQ